MAKSKTIVKKSTKPTKRTTKARKDYPDTQGLKLSEPNPNLTAAAQGKADAKEVAARLKTYQGAPIPATKAYV